MSCAASSTSLENVLPLPLLRAPLPSPSDSERPPAPGPLLLHPWIKLFRLPPTQAVPNRHNKFRSNAVNHTTKMLMLAAVLGSWSGPIRAQEPSSRMSLDEALRLFVRNNPELRLAYTREAEAEGLARQANAFPNPAVAVTHEPLSRNGQNYSETYLNLTQRFPLPGERSARRDAAGWVLEAARARVLADSAGLFFEVKRAFVETGLAEARLAMTERVAEVFRQGAQDAVIREAEGDISLYSLQRIRVERFRYENFLAEAELASAAAQRSLALLILPGGEVSGNAETIRVAPLELLGVPPLEPNLDPVLENAIDRRPEVAAADAEMGAARAGSRLARAERIPDITATGGYKRQSDGFNGAFLGLSVPLPLFDRRGGAVATSEAQIRTSEERLELTRRQVQADLRKTIESYRSLRLRGALLEEDILGGDPDLLEIAQVAYDAGEMTLVELLDAAEALRNAHSAEAKLRSDLWIAYYDLERAMGGFDAGPEPETTSPEIGR